MTRTEKPPEPLHRMFADTWRTLRRDVFTTYRPELHYMRGPGPKWREKHAPAGAETVRAALPLPESVYAGL